MCLIAQHILLENKLLNYRQIRFQNFSNTLYADRVVWLLTGGRECVCLRRSVICEVCMRPANKVILTLSTLTNLSKMERDKSLLVREFLRLPFSLGMLGGYSRRAIYVVGFN